MLNIFYARLTKILLLTFCCGLGACSYHVGDARTSDTPLKLFVPVIENMTATSFDLADLTSELRLALEGVKGVSLVNSADQSDRVISARMVRYDRTWGPGAFQGTETTENNEGLRLNSLTADSVRVSIRMEISGLTAQGEKKWTGSYVEHDFYQLSDRLEVFRGSAETPQIHASRESLLIKKLAGRIFRRAQSQMTDDF